MEVQPFRPKNCCRSLSACLAGMISLRSRPSSTGGSGIKVLSGRSFLTTSIISRRPAGAANPNSRRETVFGSRRAAACRRAMSVTSTKYSILAYQLLTTSGSIAIFTHVAHMSRRFVCFLQQGHGPSPWLSRGYFRVGFSRAVLSQRYALKMT